MKTFTRALAMVMLVSGLTSCSPNSSYLEVDGVVPPSTSCKFSTSNDTFSTGFFPLALNHTLALPERYLMGVQVKNNLDTTSTQDNNGRVLTTSAGSSMTITEVDVDYTATNGPGLASAKIPVNTVLPASGAGVVVFDLFTADGLTALSKQTKDTTVTASITFKGNSGAGSSIGSDTFKFSVLVSTVGAPKQPDGNDCGTDPTFHLVVTGNNCQTVQDTATVACTKGM